MSINYNVRDSVGAQVAATLVIAGGASLAVLPSSVTVDSAAPDDTVYFTVFGGVAPYSVFSDSVKPEYQPVPSTVDASGQTFLISVLAGAASESVLLTVRDKNGTTTTASVDITVVPQQPLAVIPTTQTIANPAINNAANYTVIGGLGPYSAFSDKPGFATVSVAGSTVTALVAAVPTEDTTVTISIYDSLGDSIDAKLILDLPPLVPLAVIPATQTISNPAGGETADYQVIGGSGGYTAFSSNPAAASVAVAGSVVTATVGTPPTTDTTVTITIYDSSGSFKTVTLILDVPPLLTLSVIPAAQTISNPAVGQIATYSIIGGSGGYVAYSSHPSLATVSVAGAVLTATVAGVPSSDTTITITVADSEGRTATTTLILDIVPTLALSVLPPTQTVSNPVGGETRTYSIFGGTGTYNASSNNVSLVTASVVGSTLTATVAGVPPDDTTITLTVFDTGGNNTTVSIVLDRPPTIPLAVVPATQSILNPIVGNIRTYDHHWRVWFIHSIFS